MLSLPRDRTFLCILSTNSYSVGQLAFSFHTIHCEYLSDECSWVNRLAVCYSQLSFTGLFECCCFFASVHTIQGSVSCWVTMHVFNYFLKIHCSKQLG